LSEGAVYLDASALTKLFLLEPESRGLIDYLAANDRWVSSSLVRVEVQRALRPVGAPQAKAVEARLRMETLELRGLTEELVAAAERVEPVDLCALDAIHLATALELASSLSAFVCYDRRLGAAATFHGLPLVAPGANAIHEP
ncbi:MAG: type II toxin-antitoxin system VapC family toxin, partial [Myxococcota bacterium]